MMFHLFTHNAPLVPLDRLPENSEETIIDSDIICDQIVDLVYSC